MSLWDFKLNNQETESVNVWSCSFKFWIWKEAREACESWTDEGGEIMSKPKNSICKSKRNKTDKEKQRHNGRKKPYGPWETGKTASCYSCMNVYPFNKSPFPQK